MLKRVAAIAAMMLAMTGFAWLGHGQAEVSVAGKPIAAEQKPAVERLYRVELDGKYGLINSKGEPVVAPIYDGIWYDSKPGNSYVITNLAEKKVTYYTLAGDKLFDCAMNSCGLMYDRLTIYTEKIQGTNGKTELRYGYKDSQGQIAIRPIYVKAFNFSEGLARVNLGKATGFIDTKGQLVIPYQFSYTADFAEGMAAVKLALNGKFGYINTSGKLVVSPRFTHAESFSDGAAVVYENGKYGYIDKTGKYILKPQFSMAQPFSEGLAFVERNGVTFYINKKGQKMIQNIKAGGTFSGGLAPASTGQKYGFINTSGKFVIKVQFEWAASFIGELAEVYINVPDSRDYIRGYMNRSGTIVWPPQQ
ncbi:WG repeat-containing protein [Paenibacillus lignilyticus]|uniref:WG repeat-containing protein n=1 Tax=Paenibacillus lignilyticus TaxID=1172615 RepID=A0ABS5CC47_9BACL|nr:WG repeat-containing protein [Paenibacillus lignilyticus]MBP3961790.1 WG repeat-containing protein [Paenibacillus lignilyticus]MBP3963539.1 WG repeat-containing protein [Paenibacillus lignilyticus]